MKKRSFTAFLLIGIFSFYLLKAHKLPTDSTEVYHLQAPPNPNAPSIKIAKSSTFDRYLSETGGDQVTSTINDPEDLLSTKGIDFTISDPNYNSSDLTVSYVSSNTSVVPQSNIIMIGGFNIRNIDIIPVQVGKSLITITVANPDGLTDTYEVDLAASRADRSTQSWQYEASDASAAIVVNNNYMLVANDEDETIRMYLKDRSSKVLNSYDFSADLGKADSRKVDIEACTRVGNTIYWMGSHSNDNSGDDRPNRERIFSTTLGGVAHINATLTFGDYYNSLETDLIDWDDNNDHGLGASFFGLGASAATSVDPQSPGGFNIEGLTMAPNSTTAAYIGFRTPYSNPTSRDKALVIPITNFTSLPGASPGTATFGTPIQLDLDGRGIRSIECNNKGCLLIAGPAGEPSPTDTFDLYFWSGNSADAAELLPTTPGMGQLNWEAIAELPSNFDGNQSVLMLVDRGDHDYYGTGEKANDLPKNHQKSNSEYVDFFHCDFSFSLNYTTIDMCEGASLSYTPSFNFPTSPSTLSYTYKIVGGTGQAQLTHSAPHAATFSFDAISAGSVDLRVIVTDQDACQDSADFSINVKATPFQLAEQNCNGCNQIRVEICQLEQLPDLDDLIKNDNVSYEMGNELKWYKNTGGAPGAVLNAAPNPNTNKPKTRKYWVSQVKEGCESDPIQVRIKVLPATDVELDLPQIGCEGAELDLAAWVNDPLGTANNYTFYDTDPTQGNPTAIGSVSATNGQVNNQEYVIISLLTGTHTYYVKGDNPLGCSSIAQATIEVYERPVVNQIGDITAASGDPVQAHFSGNLPGLQFIWFNDNTSAGLGASGLGNINFVADNLTGQTQVSNIQVIALNNNCSSTAFESFNITVTPAILRLAKATDHFLDFHAMKANQANVSLTWTSSFEGLVQAYELEKRLNSNEEFETLAQIAPQGDKTDYVFLDQQGMGNQNTYRLKVMMIDGSIQYSEEIEIGFDFYKNDRFVIYPNPNTGRFMLEASFLVEEVYEWKLTNMIGQVLEKGTFAQQEKSFELESLPQGMYHLIMTSKEGKQYLNRVMIE